MRKLVLLVCIMNIFAFYGQNNGLERGSGVLGTMSLGKPVKISFATENETIGSEYLVKAFQPSKVVTKEDKIILVDMRFNTFTQEMEILQKDKILALNHEIVQKVILNRDTFKPISQESEKIFVHELVNGNLSLFKKYEAKLKEGKITPGIQTGKPKDRIFIINTYVLKAKDEEKYSILKLKKKSILKVINENKETINYIKNNKLSFNKEEDVIKIFEYFNTINH